MAALLRGDELPRGAFGWTCAFAEPTSLLRKILELSGRVTLIEAEDEGNVCRSATNTTSKATVFYDGACPLCRAEIGLYREAPGADALEFVDLSDPGATLPDALNRDDALARFHVRTRDGRLVSGATAFAELWAQLPRWRGLARIARWPIVRTLLELAYRIFLKLRPGIVWLFVRLTGPRAR
ncbi:DUF393 domain-containing protein [Thioclava sp. F42-5]|uniref:thiol-disulfide oxidoreductase DCC family protein n=1 Tax=Thioclava sp. F42-5 TaxID=1973005 RepID=UPI00197E4919|nr:DUF393 domain-containing protein [Thioclava sp. F42-5]